MMNEMEVHSVADNSHMQVIPSKVSLARDAHEHAHEPEEIGTRHVSRLQIGCADKAGAWEENKLFHRIPEMLLGCTVSSALATLEIGFHYNVLSKHMIIHPTLVGLGQSGMLLSKNGDYLSQILSNNRSLLRDQT